MKKWSVFLLVLSLMFSASAPLKADEGMWLPMMIKRLNQRNLQEMGLQLTPEEIYSVNNSSLKDAIVSMGGFCTAEMISDQGLMLTNHHCGYDQIRSHSSVGNDYLTDGFWAMTKEEELPNEGLRATFLVRMDDVTERVLAELNDDMSEDERNAKIAELGAAIKAEAVEGTHYRSDVKDFYGGNEFYLFVYEDFEDVRLVGAPPESIGKYGGDTDNWMWPRHTGDFALFRIYTGPDGKPAPYSEDNIPLKPKHHLPISLDGVKEGDMAMILGFPGSTDRYLTSHGILHELNLRQPSVIDIRDLKLNILKDAMDADPQVRIDYASTYAQTANYWKYFIGQSRGLKRLKVYDQKKALEEEFQNWANTDADRKDKYGEAISLIEQGYKEIEPTVKAHTYSLEAGALSANVVLFSFRFGRLYEAYKNTEDENVKASLKQRMASMGEDHFAKFSYETERKLYGQLLSKYYNDIEAAHHPEFFSMVRSKYKADFDKYSQKAFGKSIFTDKNRFMTFVENPKDKVLEKDLVAQASADLLNRYFGANERNKEAHQKLDKGYRLFIAGLREMNPDKEYYPDANSTMRVTFGSVGSYNAADAVNYDYYTTIEGVFEKEDPTNDEFIVPEKLSELFNKRDFGQYADENGDLVVNFISNNDITGGNSGSPVINGKGHLIGIAFDGNWEAMSGDIAFETVLQRCISVDIRYALFIIDKYAGAKHLVDEMTLVRTKLEEKRAQPAELKMDSTN